MRLLIFSLLPATCLNVQGGAHSLFPTLVVPLSSLITPAPQLVPLFLYYAFDVSVLGSYHSAPVTGPLSRFSVSCCPNIMETPLRSAASCEVRSVIRILTAKNETAVEIHRQLCQVYGEHDMSVQMVRRWRAMFLEGRENVHDDERSGRPANSRQPDVINAVRAVIDNDN
ncbi:hypothetical protein J6590_000009 [Homalodisca vitripennis]|nr:hypothetical protein J6590_000009 [Homalodisca vitripennis]